MTIIKTILHGYELTIFKVKLDAFSVESLFCGKIFLCVPYIKKFAGLYNYLFTYF